MSALQLPKSSTYDRCYLGCGRVGKHAILIAGYPLDSERATYSSRALLCGPCRKEWRKAWDEASGAAALKQVEAAGLEEQRPPKSRPGRQGHSAQVRAKAKLEELRARRSSLSREITQIDQALSALEAVRA